MGMLRERWDRLMDWAWARPRRWWLYGVPVGAFIAFFGGIIFWGGFHTAMDMSNTLEFCISCHEMRDTVYVEYQQSPHYKNPSGVRAVCGDCHVPRPWAYKVVRKIKATNELFHKLRGTIDTPEKFEAKRLEMAQHVWADMKATDSRECRNCHSFDSMDLEQQDRQASKKHSPAWRAENGGTCIDCHKGIAHKLPDESASAG